MLSATCSSMVAVAQSSESIKVVRVARLGQSPLNTSGRPYLYLHSLWLPLLLECYSYWYLKRTGTSRRSKRRLQQRWNQALPNPVQGTRMGRTPAALQLQDPPPVECPSRCRTPLTSLLGCLVRLTRWPVSAHCCCRWGLQDRCPPQGFQRRSCYAGSGPS